MSKRGRQRKPGPREPNGKPQRAPRAERKEDVVGLVREQPHRRGNMDQLCGDALGRFILRHGLRRELYDAANQFGTLIRRYYHVIGAALPVTRTQNWAEAISRGVVVPAFPEGVLGNPQESIVLRSRLGAIERDLRKVSAEGLSGVWYLVMADIERPEAAVQMVRVLERLAVLMKLLRPELSPFLPCSIDKK